MQNINVKERQQKNIFYYKWNTSCKEFYEEAQPQGTFGGKIDSEWLDEMYNEIYE